MKCLMERTGWRGWLAPMAALSVIAATVATPALGQARDPGGRRGGGNGGGGGGAPQRDVTPSRNVNPVPNVAPFRDFSTRRDTTPGLRPMDQPTRRLDTSAPNRTSEPAWRINTPRRYDDAARRVDTPTPRRIELPDRRVDTVTPRRTEDPVRRVDTLTPRRLDDSARRSDTSSRIGVVPSRREDTSVPRRFDTGTADRADRRSDPAPRRDVLTGPARDPGDRRAPSTDRVTTRSDGNTGATERAPRLNTGRVGDRIGTPSPWTQRDRFTPGLSRDYGGTPSPWAQGNRRNNGNVDPRPQYNRGMDLFTRSREGRRFNNGIELRSAHTFTHSRFRNYFPGGYSFYPYWYPYSTFSASVVYYSPYSYYNDVCPPYIYRNYVHYYPPSVVYIETPVYVDNVSRGYYYDDSDDYYLNRYQYRYQDSAPRDRALDDAIGRIEDAFRNGRIEDLVDETDPDARVAVYRQGKYQYSLNADDYLDMTRDAMQGMDTVSFDLTRVRRRSSDIYSASGKHVYRDRNDQQRTVYVSFVLERVDGRWVITQVGTSPDRID